MTQLEKQRRRMVRGVDLHGRVLPRTEPVKEQMLWAYRWLVERGLA